MLAFEIVIPVGVLAADETLVFLVYDLFLGAAAFFALVLDEVEEFVVLDEGGAGVGIGIVDWIFSRPSASILSS